MTININEKEYKLKFTLRALLLFEKVAGTTFKFDTLSDQILYLYCLLLANNEEMDLTIDQLIEAMDNDPSILSTYFKYITQENLRNGDLIDGDRSKKA